MRTYWSTLQRFEVRLMWCRSHKLGVAQWLQREGRRSGLKRLIGARIYRATTSNWVSHKPVGTVIKTHKGESQPGIRIYKQWKEGATIQDVTKSKDRLITCWRRILQERWVTQWCGGNSSPWPWFPHMTQFVLMHFKSAEHHLKTSLILLLHKCLMLATN